MRNVWKSAAFALVLMLGMTTGGAINAQMGGAKGEPKAKEEPKEDGSKLPWSLDDIKKSIKVGSKMKLKMVSEANGTKSTMFMAWEVTEVTEKGYKAKTSYLDENGKAPEGAEDETEEKEWDSYMAELVSADAKVSTEKVKVGAGEFECKLYATSVEKDGAKISQKVWFIKDKPGYVAKIEMTSEAEGNKGAAVYTLEEIK